tara:strand:+ start:301 stop:801 length:501 start_codon:yes stop_codon:yes gene_type:complete
MKAERKVACALVGSYKWFSDKMFDKDTLRGSFSNHGYGTGTGEGDGILSDVFSIWVDTVVESVCKNKIDSQSDNILDLMSDLEEVVLNNFTEDEMKELVKIIDADVIQKLLKLDELYDVIFKSKKDMQSRIMNNIYSKENEQKWKDSISNIFPDIDIDGGDFEYGM